MKTFWFILLIFISSCTLIGINPRHKAPRHAGRYPAFTDKDSLIGYLNPYRSCYDVHFYDLHVDFNLKQKKVKGYVDIHFNVLKHTDTIQIDLSENMHIDTILSGSEKLFYKRKFDAVFIRFNQSLEPNEKIIMRVYYEGKPHIATRPPWDGGFVWKKDKNKKPWVGVACERIGAHLWWPLKDHNSDEPDSAMLHYTIPQGLFCVGNGRLQKREVNYNQTETFTWKISYPVNSYNITFYIGDYVHFSIPYDSISNHDLDFYVLKNNLDKASAHFEQAVGIIKFYESIYGSYPFPNDGYKLVESSYEGMEHQSAIAYGHRYKNGSAGFDYIILHETAHEWWGNAISVSDYADIWIHEGMATYSEALYVEATSDYENYLRYINFYALLVANKKPMVGPRDVNYWEYHDGDPYMKGALMLHSLRNSIGNDKIFFEILKTFYKKYTLKTVCSRDFSQLVNEITKADYNWFFKQFLYNRKPPKLLYKKTKDPLNNTGKLIYKWVDTDKDFIMPFDVNDGAGRIKRLQATTEEKTYEIQNMEKFSISKAAFYFTTKRMK